MESNKFQQNFADYNRKFAKKRTTILNGVDNDAAALLKTALRAIVMERGKIYEENDEETFSLITKYTIGEGRPWMLLMGKPGTGKTTYMKAMRRLAQFCRAGEPEQTVVFVKASELGFMMKNDDDTYKRIKNSTILFIDDLGFNGESEMINNYGVKNYPVNDIIESRYEIMKQTIISTNLNGHDILERYGERIHSRLLEMCNVLNFTGKNYRKK